MTTVEPARALHVPDGFDLSWYLRRLGARDDRGRLLADYSSEYRRAICKDSPLMWALVYFPHCLRSAETNWEMSLSPVHIDAAYGAKVWMRPEVPAPLRRVVTIAPRFGAKTEWYFKILPAWAMAYRHRRYLVAVSASDPMAAQQLDNLREELKTNERLKADFPSFCTPLRGAGKAYRAANGTAMMARGVGAAIAGAKVGSTRPDLILIDDPEKDEGSFSPEESAKRLRSIRQNLLGMNEKAVVAWCGTTTAYGCLAHDFVRHAVGERTADWIRDDGWKVRYYPAIVTAPDGTEASLWPQRWSIEELQAARYTASGEPSREFALNMMNRPLSANGQFWKYSDFKYERLRGIDFRVMRIDPAVSHSKTSDFYGLAVAGYAGASQRAMLQVAEQFRGTPEDLRRRVHELLRGNPSIRKVRIEGNQGGLTWRSILCPLPNELELDIVHSLDGKAELFARVLDYTQRGWVVLAKRFDEFEDQAVSYPDTRHDDCLDAGCRALDDLLRERLRPKKAS